MTLNQHRRNRVRMQGNWIKDPRRCPECGDMGPHFVHAQGFFTHSFWVCRKFYGPDGRRLEP